MGKSTISMAIFNSYVTNYQRVDGDLDMPWFNGYGDLDVDFIVSNLIPAKECIDSPSDLIDIVNWLWEYGGRMGIQ